MKNGSVNECMNVWMNEWMNAWINYYMFERTDERTDERTNEQTNERMNERMHKRTNEQTKNEWMNDWMNDRMPSHICQSGPAGWMKPVWSCCLPACLPPRHLTDGLNKHKKSRPSFTRYNANNGKGLHKPREWSYVERLGPGKRMCPLGRET